jgi:cell division protein FtsZ
MAINSPLLEETIHGATGIIVNVTGPLDMALEEVQIAAEKVKEVADPNALFMMGAAFDDELEDELRVTVIATGFGGVKNPVKEDKPACVPEGIPSAPLEPLPEETQPAPNGDGSAQNPDDPADPDGSGDSAGETADREEQEKFNEMMGNVTGCKKVQTILVYVLIGLLMIVAAVVFWCVDNKRKNDS